MKTVRIFISSPGDVTQERQRAREVIENLQRRYARHFVLKPLFWEDLPLDADKPFQTSIDLVLSEQGVDIAVFILWSRLGSPLGASIRKPDGRDYRSGTEREYDLMLRARVQSRESEGRARPALLVYTRKDDASFAEALRAALTVQEQQRLIEQKQLVEEFVAETFQDKATGANIGAYFPFDRPVAFSQRLRTHLQGLLDEFAGDLDERVWDFTRQGPPFVGLEAFQASHAEVFFGREQEILEARHALKTMAAEGCAFLLISGASGSGKSSLARAGLLPEIVRHEVDSQIAAWRSLVVTPSELGADVLAGLVMRLAEPEVLLELRHVSSSLDELARDLAREPEITFRHTIKKALETAGAGLCGGVRLLLVVDQLEELFTTAVDAESRTAFLRFVEVLARSGVAWVFATARSDFYDQIQAQPPLARLLEGRGPMYLLPPGPDAIQRLIEEPARLAGLVFEEQEGQSLASRLLRDAAPHAELLPLLEFVLLELYQRRDGRNRLTFAAYEALDGVEGALERRAEETFAALPGDAQQSLGQVLQSLVTVGEDAEQAERAVRQHAPLARLADKPAARALIDAFVAARLFSTAQSGGQATVTLAHEALLRVWPRAVAWREQNADFLRTRARVATRMKEGSPMLKGDPLLETAKAFLTTHREGFTSAQVAWIANAIAAAEAAEQRARRRRRFTVAALATLTLLAIIAAGWAWTKHTSEAIARAKADKAFEDAERQLARTLGDAAFYHARIWGNSLAEWEAAKVYVEDPGISAADREVERNNMRTYEFSARIAADKYAADIRSLAGIREETANQFIEEKLQKLNLIPPDQRSAKGIERKVFLAILQHLETYRKNQRADQDAYKRDLKRIHYE